MKENGFIAPFIIIILLIGGIVAYSLGIMQARTGVSNVAQNIASKSAAQQLTKDDIEQAVVDQKISPVQVQDKNMLTSAGIFQFSSNKVSYSLNMPKNGGVVTGTIGGVCQGTPTGNFDGKEDGKVEGVFKAKCATGPLDLINVDIEIKYAGTVSLKNNKANIVYETVKPFVGERGSFDIYFQD